METVTNIIGRPQMHGSPDVEIMALLPEQGSWQERDYLWLTDHTNRLVECSDGHIEVLPMPTDQHQAILQHLLYALHAVMVMSGGVVRCAPLRLQLQTGRFREPDLLLLCSATDPRRRNDYWTGADLVVEVVSPDDPDRDLVTKRKEYAQLGVPEYWIVDPRSDTITVLYLMGGTYAADNVSNRDTDARSILLPDFVVNVAAVFDAE